MKFTKQQFADAYKKLPYEVRQVLGTEGRSDAYRRIMDEFKLTVSEAAIVNEEAAPIIYGLVPPNDFPKNLRVRLLNFPQEKFDALVKRVDSDIFAPIRLAVIGAIHDSSRAQQQATTSTQTTPPTQSQQQTTAGVTHTLSSDIVQTKLEQSFRLPPSSTTIKEGTPAPQKPADPYREPIA